MATTTFDSEYRMRRVGDLRKRLASSGCRITPQRMAVLDALVNGPSHPTADEIFLEVRRANPSTSLATIYKTLDTLKSLGEVQELDLGSGRRHFDAVDPKDHPHVVCTTCGRIEDVNIPGAEDLMIRAAQSSGYVLTTERIKFFGLCRGCQTSG